MQPGLDRLEYGLDPEAAGRFEQVGSVEQGERTDVLWPDLAGPQHELVQCGQPVNAPRVSGRRGAHVDAPLFRLLRRRTAIAVIATASAPLTHSLGFVAADRFSSDDRSEEHTSELQSRPHLVCRLLLEKKK